jgi:L-cysteine S-thiosulfotransferase
MLRKIFIALAIIVGTAQPLLADNAKVDPKADFKAFREYFLNKFPNLKPNDFVNGPYSMDVGLRKQWLAIEEFPPYQFAIDRGKTLMNKKFKNGKSLADCFPNKGVGIRQNYPYFDKKQGKVVTLELAVNQCLEKNGEKPFKYTKAKMAAVFAYMSDTSRGKPMNIKVPNDPGALAAYKKGEEYFYTRRGQFNFACASCHVQLPGKHLRTEVLAPALGIMNAMPIYRSKWGGLGTVSRRLTSCNKQVRAAALKPQDELYRDVEYYLSYMGNGLPISGPSSRP